MGTSEVGPVRIRRANPSDQDAIFALIPRLVAFGPPVWRDAAAMSVTDRKVIGAALQSATEDPIVLVAVLDSTNIITGFLHLHSEVDYYTERKNGHVADLVVAEAYERRGIGRQLLAAAEDWAHARQFDWLTIAVFRENTRAALLYDQAGFKEDRLRLLKPLSRCNRPKQKDGNPS